MRLKHLSALFALSISLASCGENEALVDALEKDNAIPQSEIRSIDEAYEIAAQSLTWFDGADSRSSVRLLPSKNEVKVFKSKESRGESSDTLMYVVNFQDEEGFAIIPANRNLPEILAVTESGSYDPVLDSEVEPFNEYMKNAISLMAKSPKDLNIDTLREPFKECYTNVSETVTKYVEPKVSFNWGQGGINGKFCSNKLCGCSNLAVAMVCAYFEYPNTLKLSYKNDSTIVLNWANIKNHNGRSYFDLASGYCIETIPYNDQDALGHLCRELGKRAKTTYNKDGSATNIDNEKSAAKSLGFTVTKVYNYENNDEYDFLSSGYVLYVRGTDATDSKNEFKHAWIVDGYKERVITTKRYIRENDPNRVYVTEPEWELVYSGKSVSNYTHHNWGFNGLNNGWFFVGNWRTNNSVGYDDSNLVVKFDYNFYSGKKFFAIKK